MNIADLEPDERLFLMEANDFEQSFPMLIAFVHDQNPELSLPLKFEIAQLLVEKLCVAGYLQAVVVKYIEKKASFFEVIESEIVPFDVVKSAWSNPYFWGSHSEQTGGAFVAVEYAGRSCLALEPTPMCEQLLAQS